MLFTKQLLIRGAFLVLFALDPSFARGSVFNDLWSAYENRNVQMVLDSGAPLTREHVRKCLAINDTVNGYLKVSCNDFVNTYEAATFRLKGKRRLLVIIVDGVSVENRHYLEFVGGGKVWDDVTQKVLPEITDSLLKKSYERAFPQRNDIESLLSTSAHSSYRTVLPRKGTTVTIRSGLGLESRNLFHLSLDKKLGRFQFVEHWLK